MRSSLAKFTQLGAKRLFKAELKAGVPLSTWRRRSRRGARNEAYGMVTS